MNRLFSKTIIWHLLLGFKNIVNFRDLFRERLNCGQWSSKNLEMQSLVTLCHRLQIAPLCQCHSTTLMTMWCHAFSSSPLSPTFPFSTTCFLLKRLVINIAIAVYFVLGERTKYFCRVSVSFLSYFNSSPVFKPCIKKSCCINELDWYYTFFTTLSTIHQGVPN